MKKTLSHVILSAAKNLSRAAQQESNPEILRCAQNDMSLPLFYGVRRVRKRPQQAYRLEYWTNARYFG